MLKNQYVLFWSRCILFWQILVAAYITLDFIPWRLHADMLLSLTIYENWWHLKSSKVSAVDLKVNREKGTKMNCEWWRGLQKNTLDHKRSDWRSEFCLNWLAWRNDDITLTLNHFRVIMPGVLVVLWMGLNFPSPTKLPGRGLLRWCLVTDARPKRLFSAVTHTLLVSWTRINFGDRAFIAAGPCRRTSDSRTCHSAVSDSRWRHFYWSVLSPSPPLKLPLEILLRIYLLKYRGAECAYLMYFLIPTDTISVCTLLLHHSCALSDRLWWAESADVFVAVVSVLSALAHSTLATRSLWLITLDPVMSMLWSLNHIGLAGGGSAGSQWLAVQLLTVSCCVSSPVHVTSVYVPRRSADTICNF